MAPTPGAIPCRAVITYVQNDAGWLSRSSRDSHAVERSVLAERLRAQSERVVALVRSASASVSDLSTAEIQLGADALRRPARTPRPVHDECLAELTRRELEVLGMLAEGEPNARIAQRLVVSQDTVKTHVKHILRKLGVHNRSQAVSRYFRAPGASENAPFKEERSPVRSMRA